MADERRTESHDRAAVTDDYEILVSKVNKTGGPAASSAANEEAKGSGRDSKMAQNNHNTNLRAHFASPSPDIGPTAARNRNGSVAH